jgi:hypothetical protein
MLDFSEKPLIGYVQLGGLTQRDFASSYSRGLIDARRLEDGGIDAMVVENYAEPETGAKAGMMSIRYMKPICARIRKEVTYAKLGINVLQADLQAAFELARECDLDFVHADVFIDRARSKETGNLIEVDLKYVSDFRRRTAANIPLIATIKPWHSYEVLGDEPIGQTALGAICHGADALAVVGKNGTAPEMSHVKTVKEVAGRFQVPVGAGTGINDRTIEMYFGAADFFLVSGFLKEDGKKSNPVDEKRVRHLADIKNRLLSGETR